MTERPDPASFRDNRGFITWHNGQPRRQIKLAGRESYDGLMKSGLYQKLVKARLLIGHREISQTGPGLYKVIEPELVPLISYPYEWSFSQLQEAALVTLKIQRLALKHGLTLRDANAYNIQFIDGYPRLIDTLSFEPYQPGQPWIAYQQFCRHFLAPLALMAYRDLELIKMAQLYIDGIPLPLASRLLPWRANLKPGLAIHISLHARYQTKLGQAGKASSRSLSPAGMDGLIESLTKTVRSLQPSRRSTVWGNYYYQTNYSDQANETKGAQLEDWVKQLRPGRILDLGSNDGRFSRLVSPHAKLVISADFDPQAVETNYRQVEIDRPTNLVPLLVDLTNPSPGLGWANAERASFSNRAKADLVVALALIHHLAIAANLPLPLIADYLAMLGSKLIIEFVPKSDSQVQRLLSAREDIFGDYDQAGFETAFESRYRIIDRREIADSNRLLYLMERL